MRYSHGINKPRYIPREVDPFWKQWQRLGNVKHEDGTIGNYIPKSWEAARESEGLFENQLAERWNIPDPNASKRKPNFDTLTPEQEQEFQNLIKAQQSSSGESNDQQTNVSSQTTGKTSDLKSIPTNAKTDVKWTDRQGRALTGARANRGIKANFRIKNPNYTSINERRRLKDEANSNTAINKVSTESSNNKPADNQASSKAADVPSKIDVASSALSFVQNLLEGKKGGTVHLPTNHSLTIDDWRRRV